nr:MAG TPA: hypothetical protein [Bacteriophage sp.]
MTFIEEALSGNAFPDYKISIVGDGVSINSVLTQSLSFQSQVDWGSDNILPQGVQNAIASAGNVAQKVGLHSGSGFNEMSTLFKWSGTSNQTFSLNLIFALGDQGVLSNIKELNKLVYPKSKGTAGLYTAPMDYKGGSDKAGLLHVTIGSWFRATDVVCTNNQFEIDRIFDENGKPILATANVSFSAYKLLTADEMNEWFIG